ncbi:MAG TPA: hypothetical protein DCZ72_15385 [Armatimonadetes bacterium]|nr:hypothetical protein [Armatimonadota bacterium]
MEQANAQVASPAAGRRRVAALPLTLLLAAMVLVGTALAVEVARSRDLGRQLTARSASLERDLAWAGTAEEPPTLAVGTPVAWVVGWPVHGAEPRVEVVEFYFWPGQRTRAAVALVGPRNQTLAVYGLAGGAAADQSRLQSALAQSAAAGRSPNETLRALRIHRGPGRVIDTRSHLQRGRLTFGTTGGPGLLEVSDVYLRDRWEPESETWAPTVWLLRNDGSVVLCLHLMS